MRHGFDWERFVERHWEKTPARMKLPAPVLSAGEVFQRTAATCEPFRHGTRFRALPDVRFYVGHARLASPGPLLPGHDDATLGGYLDRASGGLEGASFQIQVEQPFMFDFSLWGAVRGFLRGLMERVGVPVLPATTELVLGRFSRGPLGLAKRPHHSRFTLVLQGQLRVRLWKKLWGQPANETVDFDQHLHEATTLEARAGECLYIPSQRWHLEEAPGDCMALHVWIPVKGSRPTDEVKRVLVSMLEREAEHDETVPYLSYPWRRPRAGRRATVERLEQTADTLHTLTREAELQQMLRITWARRVSACALEPVPPPDTATALKDTLHVRRTPSTDILRMKDPSGLWIWAVNGHAFPGPGEALARRLFDALDTGAPCRVDALCGLGRTAAQREEVRVLLGSLLRLRGIQAVAGTEV
ncbi:hypothetical protein A176_002604 [Myxococcus hansupus]|uniref:JmjC domain-containing protein n=1 Tax=Pseudomyxococcus hansupus TaxID=1297742 RepID=A0A0H4XCI1_9BACT|nr:hypothetical protein [Myxococcus hansupus]AKQ65692.1 hypothetical protein A176_002604 [Myxococcus hansupus]